MPVPSRPTTTRTAAWALSMLDAWEGQRSAQRSQPQLPPRGPDSESGKGKESATGRRRSGARWQGWVGWLRVLEGVPSAACSWGHVEPLMEMLAPSELGPNSLAYSQVVVLQTGRSWDGAKVLLSGRQTGRHSPEREKVKEELMGGELGSQRVQARGVVRAQRSEPTKAAPSDPAKLRRCFSEARTTLALTMARLSAPRMAAETVGRREALSPIGQSSTKSVASWTAGPLQCAASREATICSWAGVSQLMMPRTACLLVRQMAEEIVGLQVAPSLQAQNADPSGGPIRPSPKGPQPCPQPCPQTVRPWNALLGAACTSVPMTAGCAIHSP